MKSKWFWIICTLLSLYLCVFSIQKINFLTADIGRHIKNGEVFLHNTEFGVSKSDLLHTNLFSYTNPDFPFINHHWGSGILSYLIYSVSGFSGLSLVYILLIILAFILALLIVRDDSHLSDIFLVGLFLAPLVADRMEVRPETISYLFIIFFIYLLYQFSKNRLSYKILFIIPIIELFWSNLHIYFIFGVYVVGIFFFESLIIDTLLGHSVSKLKTKKLAIILFLTGLATLITPYGIYGAIYPFIIFKNYGYLVVENQSITFLQKLNFINPSFLWWQITTALVAISSIIILFKNKKQFTIALSIISVTFSVLAFFAIRNMTIFALVSLPLLIYNLSTIRNMFVYTTKREIIFFIYGILSFLIIIITFSTFSSRLAWNRDFGLGLANGSLDSIQFIQKNSIVGQFFNNYDIGSAMTFSLFPTAKVFVDNRPEAYPKEFFDNTYKPMQENNDVWKKVDSQYKFNAIYFYRLDMTPWAQKFLIQKIDDPLWSPVYVDTQTIIFLKRNETNKNLIAKYELPRSTFGN